MKLIAIRHGNTFGPDQEGGERIFMSGSKNNIPMVRSGCDQLQNAATYLDGQGVVPDAIYANHLIRTWESGEIIRDHFKQSKGLDVPLHKHDGLVELDYGNWAGLDTADDDNQVIAKFGQEAWDDWQKHRIIPNHAPHSWQVTQDQIVSSIKDMLAFLEQNHKPEDTVIVIGSQGSMTFMNSFVEGGMEGAIAEDRFKVKTGRMCFFDLRDGALTLESWNVKP